MNEITKKVFLLVVYISIILFYFILFVIKETYLPSFLLIYSISNFIFLACQKNPILNLKKDNIDGNFALQITSILCGLFLLITYLSITILTNDLKFIDGSNNVLHQDNYNNLVIMLFISFITIEYPLLITVKERRLFKPFYWLIFPLLILVVIMPIAIFTQKIIIKYISIRILIHLGIILLIVMPRFKITEFIMNIKYYQEPRERN